MDWLTFIAAIADAIAWPTCLIIIAVIFREMIVEGLSHLFKRLSSVKGRNWSVEFPHINQPSTKDNKSELGRSPYSIDNPADKPRYRIDHAELYEIVKRRYHSMPMIYQEENIETLKMMSAGFNLLAVIEGIYREIFGSQMRALSYLYKHEGDVSETALKKFYNEAKEQFSIEYEEYPFLLWLDFLIETGLVTRQSDPSMVNISDLGKAFVIQIGSSGYPIKLY